MAYQWKKLAIAAAGAAQEANPAGDEGCISL
jgi:hypothetical protein